MQNKATPTASTQRVCRQLKTWRVIALGLFLGFGGPASGDLDMDVDGDGLNDVWQGIYDAWDLLPGGDEDGDGCSNLIESVAGTNPKVSGDCLKVGDTYITGTNVFFVFDAKVGKKYRILSSDTPGGGYGSVGETLLSPDSGTEFVATNDTSKTLKITKPVGSRKFYKLETSDVDSNSDGVSDWVAQKLGYDPNAESVDLDANGKSDLLDMLEGELGSSDEVTVVASSVFASEDGPQSGSFLVRRNRSLFDASVGVGFSGTADSATDYSKSPAVSSVQFAAGETEKTIFINPNPSQAAVVEGSESVTLTLTGDPTSTVAGGAPEIGSPAAATVIINDTTVASGTGLLANYYDTSNGTYTNSANFDNAQLKVTRVDPVVDYDLAYGTPNDVGLTPNTVVDNYSTVYEGWLHPTTAGSYRFQLDGDDKARLLIDLNQDGDFDLPGEQIVEHGWDDAGTASPEDGIADDEVIGAFKVQTMAAFALAVPAGAAQRYKIRLEQVETTGSARCRIQWSRDNGTFGNPGSTNLFSHVTASTYQSSGGTTTVTTTSAHGLTAGVSKARLWFYGGALFGQATSYNGEYNVASTPTATSFTVAIPAAPTQATNANVYWENSASTTAGLLQIVYANTGFTGGPGSVTIQGAGPNQNNNGIFGIGTPDPLIVRDTFSIRWTGQVQPQFSEEYTFAVHADDGCRLWVNDQELQLRLSGNSEADGNTYNYNSATGDVLVTYTNSDLASGAFAVGDVVRLNPSSGNLTHGNGSTYTYDSATGNAVINYSNLTNITASGFRVGQNVEVDPTSGTVNLGQLAYPITAVTTNTFTVNFGVGAFASGSGDINISDNIDLPITAATSTSFTVNIGAEKYTNASTGNINIFGPNLLLKPWASNGSERYARIALKGGVRYNIRLESYEGTSYARCQLFWFSPSQPKQIIPSNRLYPSTGPVAPPAQLSDTDAIALVGGLFSHTILGSNGANLSISGAPAWLNYNNGVLSGTPTEPGNYQILISLSGSAGTSTSVLNLNVADTGRTIAREVWNGVSGTSVASIPTGTVPSVTSNLSSLAAPAGVGPSYGARIRGYITAPKTGNYYFWIASNHGSELWISNDDEPVNAFKRAWVTTGSATPETWNGESRQKSPWLALEEGKRYYIEILHKAGEGTGDNLAVGWSKPGESLTSPSEVVPGYVLSPFGATVGGSTPGTLYVATLLAQNGSVPEAPKTRVEGVGTATMRLSADETVAYVNFSYSGLTGGNTLTDWHVHNDPYLSSGAGIIFDGVEPVTPGDGLVTSGPYAGSHKWTIEAVGALSANDIRELIKQGKSYINLHTNLNPNGEIRGNFTPANGSRTFTVPPAPPAWTTDHNTDAGAVRFLTQATFGANVSDIAALKAMSSYEAWIDDQVTKPVSEHLPEVLARELFDNNGGGQFDERLLFNAWWRNSITGKDQLRQRVAFALSEILVVSAQGPLDNRSEALAYYFDLLKSHAFGNFRNLLEAVTLSPAMGRYLDMKENDKPDISIGRIPNENYAREIKQLFSIGLFRMWPDGTLILNSRDEVVPTYTQREIVGLAHLMTGWDDGYDGAYRTSLGAATNWLRQMREVPARHFTGHKRLLNNEVLPGLASIGSQSLDPLATHTSVHFSDPAYQALPSQELDFIHDQLHNHPNAGPFICRQLIQRLVTSHPSRDYVYRVVQKFNDNGSGVRGDLLAVVKAILLDYEARSSTVITQPTYGKQREAVLRTTSPARAFRLDGMDGTYEQPVSGSGAHVIKVTTTVPHLLVAGRSVYLEFPQAWVPGSPVPSDALYTVLTTPAPTSTVFYVNAKGWVGVSSSDGNVNSGITGTYSQSANSSVLTITLGGHWLPAGGEAYLDFESPTGPVIADGVYTAATSTSTTGGGTTFTITNGTNTLARSGRVRLVGFRGSYAVSSSGLPAPLDRRITLDTTDWFAGGESVAHNLNVGDSVFLNFTEVSGANIMPTDAELVVESVPDMNSFTVLTSSATGAPSNTSRNGMWMFPLVSQPISRTGTVNRLSSTFQLGSTDAELEQSPLNADTVFNFYLPDYKFPGLLASSGITTPEFQSTAETTVIRQSNFFFNGIFNPADTNGISSFRTGQHALVLDFSPWLVDDATNIGLGAPVSTTLPWTHNQNIARLIDQMSVLLTANQLSSNAKTLIRNFVSMPITSISTGNPCTVTTSAPHGYTTGNMVCISGLSSTNSANGTFSPSDAFVSSSTARAITVTGNNTFTVTGVSCTEAPTSYTNVHASQVIYNQGSTTPTASERRDRMRSVIHLILSSPDYIIQR